MTALILGGGHLPLEIGTKGLLSKLGVFENQYELSRYGSEVLTSLAIVLVVLSVLALLLGRPRIPSLVATWVVVVALTAIGY